MQYIDLCGVSKIKVLGAPASQKYILKLTQKPLQVAEHIMEINITRNKNGGENAEDSMKHLYTVPSFKVVFSKHTGSMRSSIPVLCTGSWWNPWMLKIPKLSQMWVPQLRHAKLGHLLWEVIITLELSHSTSRRRTRLCHLVKANSDSHRLTSSFLCAKWAECAQGTQHVVWFDGLKEFFVTLSCLEWYLWADRY